MTTLPPDLEALMPEPALEIGTKLLPYEERHFRSPGMAAKLGYTSNIREFFTADQVRAAILGATERANDDAARLDWIVRQSDEFSCSLIMDAPGDGEYIVHGMDGYGQGKTPREAIDNAMRFNAAASTGRGEGGEGA
jgi:hypothetical protein